MYEFEYTTNDGRSESKIFFFLYAPDVCGSNAKFVYATTKESLKKKVSPVNREMQINDWADLDEEKLLKSFKG